jgi:peptidyl-prolyl cis-trans isomerase D
MAKAQEAISNMKRATGAQKTMIETQVIQPLSLNNRVSKYSAMMSGSAYYPAWMQKADQESSKQFASISYVSIPFADISDSTVKVTDAEIDAYVAKNKELYKQEAGRVISYYSFSQQPIGEDSARTLRESSDLKPLFELDTNNASFVLRNGSAIEFADNYIPRSQVTSAFKDSVISMPVGAVYGPYLEGGNYVIAKYLGSKALPDSVGARHILIVTTDRNSGKMVRDDSAAKKLADSLLNAANTGSNFSLLAMQFSADGSKDKGGDLGVFGYGAMVPEFNDFCFNKTQGSRGVVKTQFGYHVIEITSQKNFNPAYKIAYVARPIVASDATINSASLAATKASANKQAGALADYAAKIN